MVCVGEKVCPKASDWSKWWCLPPFLARVAKKLHVSHLGDCIAGDVDESVEATACSQSFQHVPVQPTARRIHYPHDSVPLIRVLLGDVRHCLFGSTGMVFTLLRRYQMTIQLNVLFGIPHSRLNKLKAHDFLRLLA